MPTKTEKLTVLHSSKVYFNVLTKMNLSITNGIVSSRIYIKQDDFEIVNFPFLDGDVLPLLPMVYIFLSLFVLLECVLMLMTSTTETYL